MSQKKSLSKAALIEIICGTVIVLAIIIVCAVLCYKYSENKIFIYGRTQKYEDFSIGI